MRTWAFLVAAILAEVTATLSLKGALERPWLYSVVAVGYVASFLLLAGVLRAGMPLGVAYGMWGALGVAATAVLSAQLFGEAITRLMGAGLVLVAAGVFLVEAGSRSAGPRKPRGRA
jgi:small multidrug resistance pump